MSSRLTPDRLVYDFTLATDPQISPDGAHIVYSYGAIDPNTKKATYQLWLMDRDGSHRRQITFGGTVSTGARWSPDGTQLAFVSDRVGDKQQGLFILPIGGGEAREVLRSHQPISALAWSPDGTQLAYTAPWDPANPDGTPPAPDAAPKVRVTRRQDYKQDTRNDGYLGDLRVHVFVVDLATGDARRISTDLIDHNAPAWSPDGATIAAQVGRKNNMLSQLALIDVASGTVEYVGPDDGVIGSWAWSPDGSQLILTGEPSRTWQSDLLLYTVASKEMTRLTDDLEPAPGAGMPGLLSPPQPVWLDEKTVLFSGNRAGGSGLYTVDVGSEEVAPVHYDRASMSGLSVDAAKRYVVQGYADLETLGAVHVFDREAGTDEIVYSPNAALLAESPAAAWERFEVSRPPYSIEAWMLFPPGFDPAKQYPMVLDIHGGPNGAYGYALNGVQQALAAAGFIVVFSNPRGSSTYGRDFTSQVGGDWGGEDYRDLMAVVDTALERPYVDGDRLGVYGYSYGGYMTGWIIGNTDRFKVAVCGAPVFDFESFFGTSDIGYIFGDLQWGGPPTTADTWPANRSPSAMIHNAKTPTLIPVGEADERCPIGQAEQLYMALTRLGVETELVRYPGGSHLFIVYGPPEHRADYLTRVVGWFADHLGTDPS